MRVAVVIPARDEEELLGRCLTSVARAARAIDAHVVVVADSCVDATASVSRRFSGVEVIEVAVANVGLARALGIASTDAEWIATTDADSIVPPNWLSLQLDLAALHADAVVGTVRPSPDDLSPAEWRAWEASHADGRALGHVHGANLGFRASAYHAVGGFAPLAEHEDVDLVHRMRSAGFHIAATDQGEVVTSGRRTGRTPGGYARYLRDELLAGQPDPV